MTAPQQSVPSSPQVSQPSFLTDASGVPISGSNALPVSATLTPPANQRVSAQSGDFVDGAIATLGTEADAAVTNPASSATAIAALKGLLTRLGFTLAADNTNELKVSLYGKATAAGDTPLLLDSSGRPIIGNVVQIGGQAVKLDNTNEQAVSIYGKNAAAGDTPFLLDASGRLYVNVNSLPALPAGSNLIGTVELADSAGTNKLAIDSSGRLTLIPTQTVTLNAGSNLAGGVNVVDSAGTNKLAVDSSGRLTLVPNQVVEIGDGTTPTQKLAIDSSGRLTLIPNSSVNVAQINSQTPTLDNTTILATSMRGKVTTAGDTALLLDALGQVVTEDYIRYQILAGKGFSATTGIVSSVTNANIYGGAGLFNNSVAKDMLIYSVLVSVSNNAFDSRLNLTTADPAMGTAVTGYNLKAGGTGPSATLSAPAANGGTYSASVSIIGNPIMYGGTGANNIVEWLPTSTVILLPKSAANGIAIYTKMVAAGNSYVVTFRWLEV
jgi:hypothetical protein